MNFKKVFIAVAAVVLCVFYLNYTEVVSVIDKRRQIARTRSKSFLRPSSELVIDLSSNNSFRETILSANNPLFISPVIKFAKHLLEKKNVTDICIGGAITSAKMKNVTVDNIPSKFVFFRSLLPSFCKTASVGYRYTFYLGFDHVDSFFNKTIMQQAFEKHFLTYVKSNCSSNVSSDISMKFIKVLHTKKPSWAMNDALLEAYFDGVDYFYRINDDTKLESTKWAPAFIEKLNTYQPPRVGVVGPKHSGGNTRILTYDFTHKTHVDVFGFYYPRAFPDWYADTWVTEVYRPNRSTKMNSIHIKHTMSLGQRYRQHRIKTYGAQKTADNVTLQRYVRHKLMYPNGPDVDTTRIISMSLDSNDKNYTMGAVRNAQLLPVIFPGWVLRMYISDPKTSPADKVIDPRVIRKLQELGAQIAFIDIKEFPDDLPSNMWNLLVANDPNVTFLIRSPLSRLSQRDAAAVAMWMNAWQPFHCIRDHPTHSSKPIVNNLFGGKSKIMQSIFGGPITQFLRTSVLKKIIDKEHMNSTAEFLTDILWPLIEKHTLCHDSVSCSRWEGSALFPVEREESTDYIGRIYNWNMVAQSKDVVESDPGCIEEAKESMS